MRIGATLYAFQHERHAPTRDGLSPEPAQWQLAKVVDSVGTKAGWPDDCNLPKGRRTGFARWAFGVMRSAWFLTFGALLVMWQWSAPACAGASPGAAIGFRLCPADVERVAVEAAGGGVTVHVTLKRTAARRFEGLTRRGRGRLLSVLVGDEVFSRATVRAPVTSGRLVSRPGSPEDATTLREALTAPHPGEECLPSSHGPLVPSVPAPGR